MDYTKSFASFFKEFNLGKGIIFIDEDVISQEIITVGFDKNKPISVPEKYHGFIVELLDVRRAIDSYQAAYDLMVELKDDTGLALKQELDFLTTSLKKYEDRNDSSKH